MNAPLASRSATVNPIAACLAAAAICGCSGGSGIDSGPLDGIDAGGSPAGVFVEAPINGFGSVIVNGVHYDTAGTEILIDDSPGGEEQLRIGQIVRLTATTSDGTTFAAETIVYDDRVAGPIEAIDTAAMRITVLGQPVIINAATSFDTAIATRSIEGLAEGDQVAISGYVTSALEIAATRIDRKDGEDVSIRGRADNLDSGAFTFEINGLTIDYSQAVIEGGTSLETGQLVDVAGSRAGAGQELVATRVELEQEFQEGAPADAGIELEGFVTRFVSAGDFDVSGVAARTTQQTQYEDGTEADLALDVLVEVDGRFDTTGVLVADRVEFEDDGPYEIEAAVESVDAGNNRFTILGIEVEVTPETRMEDDSPLALRVFTVDDINVGDRLEVHGAVREPGGMLLTATSVEREDDDDDGVSIQGYAEELEEPSFRILTLVIDTDEDTEFDDIDRAAFFASGDGRLVEVEGVLNGGRLLAREIEIEDDG